MHIIELCFELKILIIFLYFIDKCTDLVTRPITVIIRPQTQKNSYDLFYITETRSPGSHSYVTEKFLRSR